ncbi:MAG TPA: hypothetical protein VKX45_07030 [Bryobacteraceae bacterium]|nr:hypothetical protein [Bryobacteraceae bacterium]
MTTTQTSKLTELRSKTDRELYLLVMRRLDRAPGARAREEARRFLPYLSPADRRRIERRLQDLDAGVEAPAPLRAACCG